MRRRPQPNHRRGLLRAGIAVVVLLAILLAALLLVSSLTAPAVNAPAPTPPTTPVVPKTLVVPKTPGKVTGTVAPVGTPRPTPRPTGNHGGTSKDVSLGRIPMAKVLPATILRSLRGHSTAYFSRQGTAYHGSILYVRAGGTVRVVGTADRFVRPVWSPDGRSLLYVSVAPSAQYPGAAWTLLRYDLGPGRSREITRVLGMGLEPLGWWHGHILYVLDHSSATDSSLYAVTPHGDRFLSILTTQPVSAPSLSPDGRTIAFLAPADCSYCTLTLFDLNGFTTWYGPSGIPSTYDIAWNATGTYAVVSLAKHVAAINATTHSERSFLAPRGLPSVWAPPLRASVSSSGVQLLDDAGREYSTASGLAGS